MTFKHWVAVIAPVVLAIASALAPVVKDHPAIGLAVVVVVAAFNALKVQALAGQAEEAE